MNTTKTFKETTWNVERENGHSVIVGFKSANLAHAMAKPCGFRKPGKVVRIERTRTWVHTDNATLTTEYETRTPEDEPND